MLKKSTFFCTKRDAYDEAEELSVVWRLLRRTYGTWARGGRSVQGASGPVGGGHVEAWAQWPRRCPGWFNLDAQPTNRPAFKLLPAAAAAGRGQGGGARGRRGGQGRAKGGAAGAQGATAAARRVSSCELPAEP